MYKQTLVADIIAAMLIVVLVSEAFAVPPAKEVETINGWLLVNGQPFLPIGLYHAAHYHKGLKEASEKGFNAVQVYGSTPKALKEDLDNAYANGLYGLVALNGLCEDLDRLEKLVLGNRDHPGLLVWSLEDEPNFRVPEPKETPYADRAYRLSPEKLKEAYDLIKKRDPKHPVWVNLAHGFSKDHQDYKSVADIMSADIYPVPGNTLSPVASYAEVTVKGCAGKPAWLALQMSPVRPQLKEKDRYPTIAEVRCMTFMSIAHGTTGVLYYAFNEHGKAAAAGWPYSNWRTSTTAPAYWAQWADLTAELKTLTPLILSPQVKDKVNVKILKGPSGKDGWGWAPLHLSLRRGENSYFLIAVNGANTSIEAKVTLPAGIKNIATNAAVRFENRLLELKNNSLLDSYEPHAVHLYEIPMIH